MLAVPIGAHRCRGMRGRDGGGGFGGTRNRGANGHLRDGRPLLPRDQGLDRPQGGLLGFQETLVQAGGLLLYALERLQVLLGQAQSIGGPGAAVPGGDADLRRRRLHRRPGRLGGDVVVPAQGDGECRLLLGLGLGALVPLLQPDGEAARGQPGQGAGQVRDPRALAARSVHGGGFEVAVAQDALHEPGQARAGADLQEAAHARGVQLLDLADELHRAGELSREDLARLLRVLRVFLGRAVGEHRQRGRGERHVLEGGFEGDARVGHQRAVEGRGDREPDRAQAFFGKEGGGALDLGRGARQDDLVRGVAVGEHEVELAFLERGLHRGRGGEHREHRAPVAVALRHESAAQD